MEPMIASMIAVTCVGLVLKDATAQKDVNSNGTAVGFVSGRVIDAQGCGIGLAEVIIEHTVFYASFLYGVTDPDGYYRIKVPGGTWKASVQLDKEFEGSIFKFDLCPENTDIFTGKEAAVRNFKWRLNGPRPESNRSYGNKVVVHTGHDFAGNPADIELTLVPSGHLVDGSQGQQIVRLISELGGGERGIQDVPFGRYTTTAKHRLTGAPFELKVKNTGTYTPAVDIVFSSAVPGVTSYQSVLQVK